jgi:hypothetical protein
MTVNKLQIKLMKQQVHLYRVGLFIGLGADVTNMSVCLCLPWNKLSVLYQCKVKADSEDVPAKKLNKIKSD